MKGMDSWWEMFFETQARQQAWNTNREFMRRLDRRQTMRRAASAKLRLAALAAAMAWSFAGLQWLM